MSRNQDCPTCIIVNIVCYWGEMPQAKWKRPFTFIFCLMANIAVSYWIFFSTDQGGETWVAWILSAIIFSFCSLGLAVSIWGCDKCVAQMCGKAQT